MLELSIEERTFHSWDGAPIFYRAWRPEAPQKRAVVLFHGGHEHSGRFTTVVQELNLPGVSFFGWDARGHGRSPGPRGYASSFQDLVRDAWAFLQEVRSRYRVRLEDMALMGHSEGSVIASALVLAHQPPVRAMVLGSPALAIRLYAPFALPLLKGWARVRPHASISSFVIARMLTHDAQERALRNSDPLIARPIGIRVLVDLLEAGRGVIANAGRIHTPTLVLSAGTDWVVKLSAQKAFFANLGSPRKEHIVFPGFYHEVFHETDRHLPIRRARNFLAGCLAVPTLPEPAPHLIPFSAHTPTIP